MPACVGELVGVLQASGVESTAPWFICPTPDTNSDHGRRLRATGKSADHSAIFFVPGVASRRRDWGSIRLNSRGATMIRTVVVAALAAMLASPAIAASFDCNK